MRFFLALLLLAIFLFLGMQAYRLFAQQGELLETVATLDAETEELVAQNKQLTSDLEYVQNDYNLTKELQSKFNYRKPEEKLFMLAPAEE